MYRLCLFLATVVVGGYGIAMPPLQCNTTVEHINYCGNACERTCANVLHRVIPCPRICGVPACECNRGFARYNGACVRKQECPFDSFTCPENEHVNSCGNLCETTCDNFGQPVVCPRICAPPACVCDEGFVRKGDFCVKTDQC